eukprot:2743462-Pyramimonas_sp.AAC.1
MGTGTGQIPAGRRHTFVLPHLHQQPDRRELVRSDRVGADRASSSGTCAASWAVLGSTIRGPRHAH